MNLWFICKLVKLRPLWDAFQQYNPNQRNHGSTYLTSLMAYVQSFEVLSTKCAWSSNFIFNDIQLTQIKLNSLAPCCQAQPLHGSHICWSINRFCSMNLKHFLKSSIPPLNIQTKNTCLVSKYNLFVKHHVQLRYNPSKFFLDAKL
jgi:hypothetical protein